MPNYMPPTTPTGIPVQPITTNIPIQGTDPQGNVTGVAALPPPAPITPVAPATPAAKPKSSGGGGGLAGLAGLNPGNWLASVFGGHKSSAPATTDDGTADYSAFVPHLQAAGYSPDQISQIIGQYHTQQAKTAALKNLPPEFATILSNFDANKTNAANVQQQQQTLMNPLAMQLFFSKNIAPYLHGVSQQLQQTGAAMRGSVNVNSLPPAYRNIMNQSLASNQMGINNLAAAQEGAAAAGPYLDQLNKQLEAAMQAQNYDRYVRERDLAYQQYGSLGLAGASAANTTAAAGNQAAATPTASQLAQIAALTGQGSTTPPY